MKHELHFRLNEKSITKLKKVSKKIGVKTISRTIVVIYKSMLPYLEKNQIEFQNRNSGYKIIADMHEKRVNIHVYFPENMYRQLKEFHQYLNFYSLAQILREIIDLYLNDFFQNGANKLANKIKRIKSEWELRKRRQKGNEFLRQLSKKQSLKPSIIVKYDINYRPFAIIFSQ